MFSNRKKIKNLKNEIDGVCESLYKLWDLYNELKNYTCRHDEVETYVHHREMYQQPYGYVKCARCRKIMQHFRTRQDYIEYMVKIKEKERDLKCEEADTELEAFVKELEQTKSV